MRLRGHGKQEQIYVCNFFSPEDGSALLTGQDDKISMWDVDRNMIVCQWHFSKSNNHALDAKRADKGNFIDKAFVYCADGCLKKCTVAAGLADGSIHLVDARSGVTAMSFKAHNSYICDINFSLTDGNQLVSCKRKWEHKKIWDLRNAGLVAMVLRRLPHHAAFLLVLASRKRQSTALSGVIAALQ